MLTACSGRTGPAITATPSTGALAAAAPAPAIAMPSAQVTPVAPAAIALAKSTLLAKYGEAHRARIERGVDQVATAWRSSDGDVVAFCLQQFVAEPAAIDVLFARLEEVLEQIDGHFLELGRSARWGTEVESGPMLPVDGLLAAYDAGAHVTEDLFTSKVAFTALLNFPLTRLADRLRDGAGYSRRMWAEVRLTGRFSRRVPGELSQAASASEAAADQYIAGYNLWMHHVLGEHGERRFPSNKRLISHWNLRDELKANYADKDGLGKQRTIAGLMDRIVTQTIPLAVIDNPTVDWDPVSNRVVAAAAGTVEPDAPKGKLPAADGAREPDTRFENVRRHFQAARAIDRFSPLAPTFIERAFTEAEIPEERVRALLVEILASPLTSQVAHEIEQRLGRPLEPHDLWYEFGGGDVAETELDAVTRKRYPTAAAFASDVPRILRDLGFSAARAKYLAEHIAVDPSRGAGHAMEAKRRGDKAHLRTRVVAGGMDYKGYNIAVHELGHNIEQVFSLYDVDHTLLAGVPNTAFTEALAFLFQARDLDLLGRPARGAEVERLRVLDAFWNTREIAGSALVEIDVWHWLYDHPAASAAELREATVRLARETWDRYYAPYLHGHEVSLLGIYSHTIASPLYLFNYVVGHAIAFQVEEHVAGKDKATFAREFERVARLGSISPDLWMQQATGKPVTVTPMLEATARALRK
ncbi:MAG: hypothetical protein H6Q90_679 [Deltaproteobacteria bacterium]|nr:hypothetical protein [Deltaproteobacteria bacterium]